MTVLSPLAWGVLACSLLMLGHVTADETTVVVLNLLAAGSGSIGIVQELEAGGWLGREAR